MRTTTRRSFLAGSLAAAAGAATSLSTPSLWPAAARAAASAASKRAAQGKPPVVVASKNGLRATARAFELLRAGGDPLDAVVAGVNLVEDDPEDTSVGYGGLPNEDGVVELDASCMHGPARRGGAVAALRNIRHPSRVAQLVAFRTDHVLLVGEGALRFARAHGFQEENLLTDKAREQWLRWKETLSDQDDWLPPPPAAGEQQMGSFVPGERRPWLPRRGRVDFLDEHAYGTVNCNALDTAGNLAGVTTTSGLAYKIPGRVGDSPILGAGLYVDNEVGACGSTGRGEENLQRLASFLAVEEMRRGRDPLEAGLEVLRRVAAACEPRLRDAKGRPAFDIKYYLVNRRGEHAGVSMWSGGEYAVTDAEGSRTLPCAYLYERDE